MLTLSFAAIICAAGDQNLRAQGVSSGVAPTVIRDAELEKESLHNLEVARHYFRLKKAYKAALLRCEEIIAGNPNFKRVDEAYYLAGMSSLRLAENRGKQRAQLPADKLRNDAKIYLSHVVTEFPDSEFRKPAEEALRTLGVTSVAEKPVAKANSL